MRDYSRDAYAAVRDAQFERDERERREQQHANRRLSDAEFAELEQRLAHLKQALNPQPVQPDPYLTNPREVANQRYRDHGREIERMNSWHKKVSYQAAHQAFSEASDGWVPKGKGLLPPRGGDAHQRYVADLRRSVELRRRSFENWRNW